MRPKCGHADQVRNCTLLQKGHFPTDLSIFCGILSRHTFTHFCIGHFPTYLRIILLYFVAKEVYALLLKSLPGVFFFLARSFFSFPCLSQSLSTSPAPATYGFLIPKFDECFVPHQSMQHQYHIPLIGVSIIPRKSLL